MPELFEYDTNGDTYGWGIWGVYGTGTYRNYGQTFTVSTSHTITSIKVRCLKRGSASGNLVVKFYEADDSRFPTGDLIGTGSIAISGIGTTTAWYEITLDSETAPLAPGNYTWYPEAPSCNNGNDIIVNYDDGHTYTGGNAFWADDDLQPSWATISDADMMFEIYGNAVSAGGKSYGLIF